MIFMISGAGHSLVYRSVPRAYIYPGHGLGIPRMTFTLTAPLALLTWPLFMKRWEIYIGGGNYSST
jgi:hypothetical protein